MKADSRESLHNSQDSTLAGLKSEINVNSNVIVLRARVQIRRSEDQFDAWLDRSRQSDIVAAVLRTVLPCAGPHTLMGPNTRSSG